MKNTAEATDASQLRSRWVRLGYRFAGQASAGPVDIEATVVDSLITGREFPDLFWAAFTWIRWFGDYINIPRLTHAGRRIKPLVAAVAECALQQGADTRLSALMRRTHPQSPGEILFTPMARSATLAQREKKESLDIFTKWGYFCAGVQVKQDALHDRGWILTHNKNLALRALFGPHARADILFALINSAGMTIRQLSASVGISYQPVYTEVDRLCTNGLLNCRSWGNARVVSLTDEMYAFLECLPPTSGFRGRTMKYLHK